MQDKVDVGGKERMQVTEREEVSIDGQTAKTLLLYWNTMTDVETRPAAVPVEEEKPVADSSAGESTTTAGAAADTPNDQQQNNNAEAEPVTTVFHDRINYNVKHPLHNSWTLWFDNPGKKASVSSWSQNLKEIVTLDTVEDFWG